MCLYFSNLLCTRLILTKTPTSFTEFAVFLLHNPSFDWTISTPKLRVTALGTIFDNVSLSKVITFKAFNGLPGVTISSFQLPSDDPAGGIHIETDASIPSQARKFWSFGPIENVIDSVFLPQNWELTLVQCLSSLSSREHLLVVSKAHPCNIQF